MDDIWTDFWESDDDIIHVESKSTSTSNQLLRNKTISSVSSVNKPMKWLTPSFDGFTALSNHKPDPQFSKPNKVRSKSMSTWSHPETTHNKRLNSVPSSSLRNNATKQMPSTSELWVDKYSPQQKNDLIVHHKKVGEVEAWLNSYFHASYNKNPFLLLSGPAGAGKTATVQVLARQMSCDVQEWCNVDCERPSVMMDDMQSSHYGGRSSFDHLYVDSQSTRFKDYLLRCNKYRTLPMFEVKDVRRKVILVEEFPNAFMRDASVFHEILRQFKRVAQCPLVCIVSDSTRRDSMERCLFAKEITAELGFTHISFNAVAVTLMTKLLNRIVEKESSQNKIVQPSEGVIETLALSGCGDIRGSINALQFTCLRHNDTTACVGGKTQSAPMKRCHSGRGKGRLRKDSHKNMKSTLGEEDMAAIGARDTSVFLFRALGKILYCKRLEDDGCRSLPSHLAHHHRPPLAFSPEDVIDKAHMSRPVFVSFLQQNYLSFYTNVDDIVRASDYISDSDYITSRWQDRESLEQCAVSVAARGLLHAHHTTKVGASHSWKPLHQSQWFNVHKKVTKSSECGGRMFRGLRCTRDVLLTDLLPYMSLINITLHDPCQINFIQEVTKFSHVTSRHDNKTLGERDIVTEGDSVREETQIGEDVPISNSQSNVLLQEHESDEELVIDEYDF